MKQRTVALADVVVLNPRMPKFLAENQQQSVAFVPMASVSERGILTEFVERPLREVIKGFTYFESGDVLLAKITPCMENGKACLVPVLPNKVGFGSTEFHVLRATEAIDRRYLFHCVWNADFRKAAAKNMTGSAGQKRVPSHFLSSYKIPLPPLPEQKRIAAILDKADAIRRKREKAIDLTDSFLRSVFLEMFGDPVVNSKNWEVQPLKDLTTKIGSGATPRGGEASYKSSGITLIRSMNVRHLSFEKKGLVFLDDQQADELSNVEVGTRDVLLNITGASVCRCCLVDPSVLPARVNQHVAIIRTKEQTIDPTYLTHLINSPNYQRFLLNKARGAGATREALTKGQIEELLVPVPPSTLQEKFKLICLKAHKVWQNQDSSLSAVESLSLSLQDSLFQHKMTTSLTKFVDEQEVAHAL